MAGSVKDARVAAVTAIGVGLTAALTLGSGGHGHRVFVVTPDAANVIPGVYVRAGGQNVGKVASLQTIRGGRAARIELRIDDQAWPLTRRTKLRLRWGGTIVFNNRYIEMHRGPAGAPAIGDGGTLPTANFTVPVEFDQLLRTFTPSLRHGLKAMIDNGGAAYRVAERPLRRSLASAPPALSQTSAVLEDLEAQSADLDTLVRSTDSVVNAMRRADPGVGRLVSSAAATLDATASRAQALRSALRETPRTLASTRATMARAEFTLKGVGELTDRLAPGVDELRKLARPLAGALASVVLAAPDARSALATTRRAAPSLSRLLVRTTDLMPRIGSIGRQSAEQLKCIRPYAPEIAAYFSTWGDWTSNSDGRGTYTRIASQAPPYSNAETANSAEIAQRNPGLSYAFPRPPGMNAGQPWLLPECGAGRDALDPAKDPEARSFKPVTRDPFRAGLTPRPRP